MPPARRIATTSVESSMSAPAAPGVGGKRARDGRVIDDRGLRRKDRAQAVAVRFALANLGGVEQPDAFSMRSRSRAPEIVEAPEFALLERHDQFATRSYGRPRSAQ